MNQDQNCPIFGKMQHQLQETQPAGTSRTEHSQAFANNRPAAVRDCSRTLVNVQFVMFPQSAFPAVGVAFLGISDSFDLGSCEIRNQLADFRGMH